MSYEEALAWLRGERSMTNLIYSVAHGDDRDAIVARADAAATEQAYWIVRAHQEGLVREDT